jgi:hypothetical protein
MSALATFDFYQLKPKGKCCCICATPSRCNTGISDPSGGCGAEEWRMMLTIFFMHIMLKIKFLILNLDLHKICGFRRSLGRTVTI